ncbi:hypothetical protein IEQ34_012095 [Dendrobium chrysotoxum]|uniref:Uncharacterized protein n=1 Tax=Dendrobium chrysotoxum TaxID=161865 RepID=A0AAV7GRM6_DENCH|nr:hypothetical protein IEQ34_012095 [Dendrobium chrysotoxum]
MSEGALLLPSPIFSPRPISFVSRKRRTCLGARATADRNRANLVAQRKERVKLPKYMDGHGRSLSISEFLHHQSGVEALLNIRALQGFESIGSNTYRCTLHKIQFMMFEVAPVLVLRVIPTSEDCTVEMLSCKFEGPEYIEKQNNLFSVVMGGGSFSCYVPSDTISLSVAFMRNHITWEMDGSEPCLDVDVNLSISLEVYTMPFSLLPISAVEKPGTLVMQGLIDRLVPLLAEQLLNDYASWVDQQRQLFS